MTRLLGACLTVLAVWTLPNQAIACPGESETVLFHSCWGKASAELLLLPDALPIGPPEDAASLVVTGAYTGTETRKTGTPMPVGIFVWQGEIINRNLGRMDGILIIDQAGWPTLWHRERVELGDQIYNLNLLDQRSSFLVQIEARRFSVMQSHLLVVDGQPDVTERDDAPSHVRRLLIADALGFGLWQSARPMTLHEAAESVATRLKPRMALNLDMGSFDYCHRQPLRAEPVLCGSLQSVENPKLSSLLQFLLR